MARKKKKNNWSLFIILISSCVLLSVYLSGKFTMIKHITSSTGVRYVAIGDSYTIGQGVDQSENYPSLLTKHLKDSGVDIELVANPSVTGYTTQNVIENELPVYNESNPTIATLMIGTNDVVQGVDKNTFRKHFIQILDRMQEKLPKKQNLVILTIPDFSIAPFWHKYYSYLPVQKEIDAFNTIIKEEAAKRNLPVVDITAISERMDSDQTFYTNDGLHPSVKEYMLWEKELFPVAFSLLKNK